MKPKVLIMSGYGINCEEETAHAFDTSGAKSEIVHINDLIASPKKIDDYQIMAYPGGFAYGDDTGAGNAYANKVRNNIWDAVAKFVEKDKLVIGICNGFQIVVNLGLVPALDEKYGTRQVALVSNDNARYTARWVDLKIKSKSPWLVGMSTLSCPIAHGEGKFFAEKNVLAALKKNGQIAATYIKGDICEYQSLEANPNGSLADIAAITDESGRVLGMMPHPERGMFFTQRPDWPQKAEILRRKGKQLPEYADGIRVFQNGVDYFK